MKPCRRATLKVRRLALPMFLLPLVAHADCAQQLQLLGEDLKGVALTQARKQEIGVIFDDARRRCWVHMEDASMAYIVKARKAAGIGPPREEFDWENVPLESLEKEPAER
jgi:hypothetical protein